MQCVREKTDFFDCFVTIQNGLETVIYPCGCLTEEVFDGLKTKVYFKECNCSETLWLDTRYDKG